MKWQGQGSSPDSVFRKPAPNPEPRPPRPDVCDAEDPCAVEKETHPLKALALDEASLRLLLSYCPFSYDEKGGGRFCSFVLWLLQQEKEHSLRQQLPS